MNCTGPGLEISAHLQIGALLQKAPLPFTYSYTMTASKLAMPRSLNSDDRLVGLRPRVHSRYSLRQFLAAILCVRVQLHVRLSVAEDATRKCGRSSARYMALASPDGVQCKCRYESTVLKITVTGKWLSRSVRESIIEPFVKRYNAKNAAHVDPYSVRCRTEDGLAIEGYEECGPVLRWLESFRNSELRLAQSSSVVCSGRWGSKLIGSEELALIASTRAKARPTASSTEVALLGSEVHRLLNDASSSVETLRSEVERWIAACIDAADMLACVDSLGRTALHAAATRGDAVICAQLAMYESVTTALDDDLDTPVGLAAQYGRSLVLDALLGQGGALVVNEKNKHLMTPLQLACCEDGVGSPEVARLLVSAGADVNATCWDKTPLMAASAANRIELVQTLVEELGADVFLRNGEGMMAADYCRTSELAELFSLYMERTCLPGPKTTPMSTSRAPPVRPCINLNTSLSAAFAQLELDPDVASRFAKDGITGLALARRKWRELVLRYHPDKHPPDFMTKPSEERAEWLVKFHDTQRAFGLIESRAARVSSSGIADPP